VNSSHIKHIHQTQSFIILKERTYFALVKNTITYLFISLIFIFSCNTEAKFGFREKVKVDNHTTAKIIAKPHVTKPEEKKVDTDTSEIITANSSDENLILPQTPPYKTSISIKKLFTDSTNKKKKNDVPIPEKQLNRPAFVGFLLHFLGLMLIGKLGFFALIVLIPAFVLSIIGYFQIDNHREKYRGFGFAILGVFFGTFVLLLFALAIYLFTHFAIMGG